MLLPDSNGGKTSPGTQAAISLGYQMLSAMAIFVGGGYYLDSRQNTGHLYTLIGIALAFTYSGYEVWKLVRVLNKEDEKSSKPPAEKPRNDTQHNAH